jgi:hypothetical protein
LGKDSFTGPYFRPDGKALYAMVEKDSTKPYVLPRVAMWSWPSPGAMKIVSPDFDRPITTYAVTPDNRTLVALAEEAGHEKLFSMPAEGGPAALAFRDDAGRVLEPPHPTAGGGDDAHRQLGECGESFRSSKHRSWREKAH